MATFQKRSGSWRAIITKKGYPRQSQTFDTKAEAEAWASVLESEMARGVFVDRSEAEKTTLAEALERYQREVTPQKKGAPQERVRIAAWLRDPLAARSLASLRGADFAKWRDERIKRLSATTIRNDLGLISHLFTIAVKEWGLESLSNPVQKIKLPSPDKARERRLCNKPDENGQTEETRLLAECDAGPRYLGPMVRLALETAMRQGELLALEWKNIDLGKGTAKLEDTKNGDRRIVPLSSKAIAILNAFPRNISGRVFSIETSAIGHSFLRACRRAGIEDFHFHDLRHEATSRLFEKGLAVEEVRAITGHKTLAMLMRYTHLRAEDLAKKLG